CTNTARLSLNGAFSQRGPKPIPRVAPSRTRFAFGCFLPQSLLASRQQPEETVNPSPAPLSYSPALLRRPPAKELPMFLPTLRSLLAALLLAAVTPLLALADEPLWIGLFDVDVSPPVGSPLAYD